jgi:carboxyl-terminal processing protease
MKRIRLLWIMAVLVVANFVTGIHVVAKLSTSEGLAKLDLIPQAMYIIENNYVEPVEKEKLVHGAVRGMLGSLDLHSEFLPPTEATNMEVNTSGTYGGLGIEITRTNGLITVVSPFVDSPAYRAGLMAGDRIVKVDDEVLRNVEREEVLSKLRGEPGTKVTLMVVRYDPRLRRETIKSFTLTRAIIKVNSIVEPKILEDSIGYVRITQFQKRTASDLHKALAGLESRGISALILDLRDNPGGLLPAAVEVADLFIPGGRVIISLKGRHQEDAHDYVSHETGTHPMYPLIVLINGQSASGSEIVAAALQDLKRGVLVGETSYGKALVQTMFRVGPKSALKLTTGKYYTPSGRSIQGKGIEPDVVVSVTPEQE